MTTALNVCGIDSNSWLRIGVHWWGRRFAILAIQRFESTERSFVPFAPPKEDGRARLPAIHFL